MACEVLASLVFQIPKVIIAYVLFRNLKILGECLLISSLPGKALRTLVDIVRLAKRFNMRCQS